MSLLKYLNKKDIQILLAKHVISQINEDDNDVDLEMKEYTASEIQPMKYENMEYMNINSTNVMELRQLTWDKSTILCATNINVHIIPIQWSRHRKTGQQMLEELPIKLVMKHWCIMFCNNIDKVVFLVINNKMVI